MISAPEDSDSYSNSSYSVEDTFAAVGSLDVYDGTLPAPSLNPLNSLNPIDPDDEFNFQTSNSYNRYNRGGSGGGYGYSNSPHNSTQFRPTPWNDTDAEHSYNEDPHHLLGPEMSASLSKSANSLNAPRLHRHTA